MKPPTRIPLRKLKTYPTMRRHLEGKRVRIYSREHRAWWREGGHGYTTVESDAGIFDFNDAYSHTWRCDPSKQIVYEVVEPEPQITDEQLWEWDARHHLDLTNITDLRCAFEDARSMKPL